MSDGRMPEEIELSNSFKRFGAFTVLGRPMSALEIKRISLAERVVNTCVERGGDLNAAVWMQSNPEKAEFFNWAMMQALDMGLIKEPVDA